MKPLPTASELAALFATHNITPKQGNTTHAKDPQPCGCALVALWHADGAPQEHAQHFHSTDVYGHAKRTYGRDAAWSLIAGFDGYNDAEEWQRHQRNAGYAPIREAYDTGRQAAQLVGLIPADEA